MVQQTQPPRSRASPLALAGTVRSSRRMYYECGDIGCLINRMNDVARLESCFT